MRKLFLFSLVLALSVSAFAQRSRHFVFHYKFSVRGVAAGETMRVWFPMARSDEFQDVKVLSITSDLPLEKKHDKKFGDAIFYADATKTAKPSYDFDVAYDVVRREHVGLPRDGAQPVIEKASRRELTESLAPDKLVPVTGKLATIAQQQVAGHSGTLDRAQALYDYVFNTMRYDKSGTGWGRGDAEWACDSKRGNCTDFHSVFISMARSEHIPARFEIGFPLPAAQTSGEVPGYHCWAEFYDQQYGWVPVDISEAWKHPDKKSYFFGAHDANRVQFSLGRDILLEPRQAGEPLNYFVYPHVEINGSKWENVSNQFSFAEPEATSAVAGAQ